MSAKTLQYKGSFVALLQLVKRNLKLFLKDRAAVFFSLLAPMIILLLYVLFLGKMQIDSLKAAIPAEAGISDGLIKALVNAWMLAGVMSVSAITVSLNAHSVMVQDKVRGVINDSLASPVKSWVITAGYFVYNFIVTALICLIILVIGFVFLAATGGFFLSLTDVFVTIGTTLLSALAGTMLTGFLASFFRSESALSAFGGIVSAAIGFIIGAYMPIGMFAKPIQYIIGFVPGTYSAGLFRNAFMNGALEKIAETAPVEFIQSIRTTYTFEIDFFGASVGTAAMALVLAGSALLFLALNLLIVYKSKKGRK